MTAIPAITLTAIAVCTVLFEFSLSPAPRLLASTTFTPTASPVTVLTISEMVEPVAPTAAVAADPAKCPTTARSAALKRI